METIKTTYGKPLARKLVAELKSLGVDAYANSDINGQWHVYFNNEDFTPPNAAAACYMLMGILEHAKASLSANLELLKNKYS
jgi:hypothetical protein